MKENKKVTERKERVHEVLQIHSSPVPPSYLFFGEERMEGFVKKERLFGGEYDSVHEMEKREREKRERLEREEKPKS